MWLEIALTNARPTSVDKTTGTHQLGRRAMSAKASNGEKKTPIKRDNSPIRRGSATVEGSNGGGVGTGSGVMAGSLSICPKGGDPPRVIRAAARETGFEVLET